MASTSVGSKVAMTPQQLGDDVDPTKTAGKAGESLDG